MRGANVPEDCLNQIYQQVGELVQGVRALGEMIEVRHCQAEKLHDIVRADLVTLRQDQRDLEEKLDCVICVMQHDLEGLRADTTAAVRSVDALTAAVQSLHRPVEEIVALRSRVGGVLLGLGVLGSAAIWLAEPVYRWVVQQHVIEP